MTTEAKVGIFVLVCFAVLAVTVLYLVNAQFPGNDVPYRTYLRYAGGLETGATVLFGGIEVGRVTTVRPWTSDPTRIEILFAVKSGTPLNEKSVAKLGLVSIMNGTALSISTGTNDAKRLRPGSRVPSQEAPSLDEIASKMAAVADNANALITQVQGELEDISGDAHNLLANLNTVTGPANQRRVRDMLDQVNLLLSTERPKIDRISDQLLVLTEHSDQTVQNVNGAVSDLRDPVRKDLAELQATLQQARSVLADRKSVV